MKTVMILKECPKPYGGMWAEGQILRVTNEFATELFQKGFAKAIHGDNYFEEINITAEAEEE